MVAYNEAVYRLRGQNGLSRRIVVLVKTFHVLKGYDESSFAICPRCYVRRTSCVQIALVVWIGCLSLVQILFSINALLVGMKTIPLFIVITYLIGESGATCSESVVTA
jgi:hypothetical protein